jgi:aminopeptidase YwaD
MIHTQPTQTIARRLHKLAGEIGSRPTGSPANQQAASYLAAAFTAAGLQVELQSFDCLDWSQQGAELSLAGEKLPCRINDYTMPCQAAGPLMPLASLAELEARAADDLRGHILLLHGELSREPLAPKNFRFWNPEEHQRIIHFLEDRRPQAVILASSFDANPPPLIEDGDFEIPSVTVAAPVAQLLLVAAQPPSLIIRARRRPSTGVNVIARRQRPSARRLVFCAHFDTKPGTPGALDNAAGCALLVSLAEAFAPLNPPFDLEFVAFNGEDYYSNPGQIAYLDAFQAGFGNIETALNVDGAGWQGAPAALSFYNTPKIFRQRAEALFQETAAVVPGDPWVQGDHSIFVMNGVPAMALTSLGGEALIDHVIHTAADAPDLVDPANLAEATTFLARLFLP